MALRSGHGAGSGRPHIEVLPADETPHGVPVEPERGADGRFTRAGAKRAGSRGGRAKAANAGTRFKLEALLGLSKPEPGSALSDYVRLAEQFARDEQAEIMQTTGGGRLSPGTLSMVATAALEMAASRWLFDRGLATGDADLMQKAMRLADASRQNLLAASERAAKDATRRAEHAPDDLAIRRAEFQRQLAARAKGELE